MAELRRRVVTAAIALPVVVGAIMALPTPVFGALFGALAAIGAWEWAGLRAGATAGYRGGYAAATAAALAALGAPQVPMTLTWAVLLAGVAWWSAALALVVRTQQQQPAGRAGPLAHAVCGWLVLVPAWLALYRLHGSGEDGPALVLGLLVVVWVADVGAYFAGRRFGRRKLAPRVSPGKTWEGLAGAVAAVVPVGVAFALAAGIVGAAVATFAALCAATALVSVVGDLTESVFKRRAGVKDSGTLFPGHGGVLDRIDSITAAAPCFVMGLALHGGAS